MALKIVRDANKNRALLEPFAPFTQYSRQDLDLDLRVLSNDGSDAALVRQAFNLTKSNMKELYDACPGWGWSDKKKTKEIEHHSARILACTARPGSASTPAAPARTKRPTPTAELLAFAHFRFEVEAAEPTLYVYDIQISPQAQRRGLGRFVMQLIELVAWRVGMTSVMLTVFEGNRGGRRLYEALGYVKSIDSPDYGVERSDKGYSILRKQKPVPRNKA